MQYINNNYNNNINNNNNNNNDNNNTCTCNLYFPPGYSFPLSSPTIPGIPPHLTRGRL